jgi:hypothetical protein
METHSVPAGRSFPATCIWAPTLTNVLSFVYEQAYCIAHYRTHRKTNVTCKYFLFFSAVSGLDGRGVGVRVPVGVRFSPHYAVQTGCGAHSALLSNGYPRVKQQRSKAWHSPPTIAKMKNIWIYISTTLYVLMA